MSGPCAFAASVLRGAPPFGARPVAPLNINAEVRLVPTFAVSFSVSCPWVSYPFELARAKLQLTQRTPSSTLPRDKRESFRAGPSRRPRPPKRVVGPGTDNASSRTSASKRPAAGASPAALTLFLRAAACSGTAADVAWAVRELATYYNVVALRPSTEKAEKAEKTVPGFAPQRSTGGTAREKDGLENAEETVPSFVPKPSTGGITGEKDGLSSRQCRLPFELWRSALHACLTRCRDLQAGMVVLHAGEQLVPPSHRRRDAYVPVILALAASHRWDALISLYRRLWGMKKEAPHGSPDERLVVYGANLAVDAGRVAVAAKLVHEMEKAGGIAPTVYSFAVLLKGQGRARNIHAVDRILQEMRERNVGFDQVTFNSAVDAYVRCGDLSGARALVDKPSVAHLRDTRTFNIILKGLARRCLVEEAFHVRNEIIAAGLMPNDVTLNTLVDACVRVGDFSAALKLANEVAAGPGSVKTGNPDQRNQLTIALSRILAGLAEAGNLEDAIRLLDEMESRGAPPNHITYCALINACLRHNDVPRARMLFRSQEQRTGIPPTLEVYNAMIAGLCKVGDEFNVDAAVRLLCRMRDGRHGRFRPQSVLDYDTDANLIGEPDEQSGTKNVDRTEKGDVDSASAQKGPTARGNQFENCGSSGDAELPLPHEGKGNDDCEPCVKDVFVPGNGIGNASQNHATCVPRSSHHSSAGVTPSDMTYNAVIDGLVRFNRVHDAEDVLEWMCEDGVTPSVITYTTLIKGWGVERDLAEARRVFRRMANDGIEPDKLALNAFINASVRSDNAATACQVLDMMESKNSGNTDISPDVWSYTPLIALHTRRGNLDDVWKIYSRARDHDMVVNKYVADLMVNAIVALGSSRVRQGGPVEREAIADMAVTLLRDVWEEVRDRNRWQVWRRRLLAIFEYDPPLRDRVGRAPNGGALTGG